MAAKKCQTWTVSSMTYDTHCVPLRLGRVLWNMAWTALKPYKQSGATSLVPLVRTGPTLRWRPAADGGAVTWSWLKWHLRHSLVEMLWCAALRLYYYP